MDYTVYDKDKNIKTFYFLTITKMFKLITTIIFVSLISFVCITILNKVNEIKTIIETRNNNIDYTLNNL